VLILLTACASSPPEAKPGALNVYATSAVYPWLSNVYDCAPHSMVVRLSDPASADLSLRLGLPGQLSGPAFQIGVDDVLVVTHPQIGTDSLTLDQTRQLFAGEITNWQNVGGGNVPVQVWTFSHAEDVQEFFDHFVMGSRPVTSMARLAVSAQAMSDAVSSNPGSIGLLPRRWKAGNTLEALKISSLPVLALVRGEPQGPLHDLLQCLQTAK